MKAIDFACRFLAAVAHDPMPPAKRLVLLSVAAGLETPADIARHCKLTLGTCTNLLRQLERGKLVRHLGAPHDAVYLLSPAGKEHVRKLFDFMPSL